MCKENCTENDDNIGFDNNEGGDNYGRDYQGKETLVCHKRGDVRDKYYFKNNKRTVPNGKDKDENN